MKLLFAISGLVKNFETIFSMKLGVDIPQLPALRIIQNKNGNFIRYKHTEVISKDSIVKFFEDVISGKKEPYYRSLDPPQTQGKLYKLVGYTFDKAVNMPNIDVLVLYCSSDFEECKDTLKLFNELAVMINDKNLNVIISWIDMMDNDIKGFNPKKLPVIHLFPAVKGQKKPIKFTDEINYENIIDFLRDNTFNKLDMNKHDL
jgi:hypothetical protein